MKIEEFVFKPKKCNQCGLEFDLIVFGFKDFNNLPKYCPNCAADLNNTQED